MRRRAITDRFLKMGALHPGIGSRDGRKKSIPASEEGGAAVTRGDLTQTRQPKRARHSRIGRTEIRERTER